GLPPLVPRELHPLPPLPRRGRKLIAPRLAPRGDDSPRSDIFGHPRTFRLPALSAVEGLVETFGQSETFWCILVHALSALPPKPPRLRFACSTSFQPVAPRYAARIERQLDPTIASATERIWLILR